jgi:hypothetical protein
LYGDYVVIYTGILAELTSLQVKIIILLTSSYSLLCTWLHIAIIYHRTLLVHRITPDDRMIGCAGGSERAGIVLLLQHEESTSNTTPTPSIKDVQQGTRRQGEEEPPRSNKKQDERLRSRCVCKHQSAFSGRCL